MEVHKNTKNPINAINPWFFPIFFCTKKTTQDFEVRFGGRLRLGEALDRHGRRIHSAGGEESLPRRAGLQTDP